MVLLCHQILVHGVFIQADTKDITSKLSLACEIFLLDFFLFWIFFHANSLFACYG